MSDVDKLTDSERRYVEEYLIDLRQKDAAIRAGYSPKSAHVTASRLMDRARVRSAIDKALADRSRRTGITQDRVLRELGRLAFVNPLDVVRSEDGTIRLDADPDDAAAIAGIKVKTIPTDDGEIVEREVKIVDKVKALELLGKHLGLFEDKVKLTVVPKIVDDV